MARSHQHRLREICSHLLERHATPGWWPAETPFEVMVGAVLVQNTRWANVERAIARLRQAGRLSPRAIATCPPEELAALLRPAGCQSVKGKRLRSLAAWLVAAGGLRRVRARPAAALRKELLGIHGVGAETADAILCFALDEPVFVADRYARRLLGRVGVLPGPSARSYEACRRTVEEALNWPATKLQHLHGAIVSVSQTLCRRTPRCTECSLERRCNFNIKQGVIIRL
jgi:endonuclease-3 related protein